MSRRRGRPRSATLPPAEIPDCVRLYVEEAWSTPQIARAKGCPVHVVRARLLEAGVTLRSVSDATRLALARRPRRRSTDLGRHTHGPLGYVTAPPAGFEPDPRTQYDDWATLAGQAQPAPAAEVA